VNGNYAGVLLAALAGFVLGGVVASRLTQIAQLLLVFGSLGALVGGSIGATLGRDVTTDAAVGGGFGLVLGLVVVTVDAVVAS
jgi:hypothetical protein